MLPFFVFQCYSTNTNFLTNRFWEVCNCNIDRANVKINK